MARRIDLVTHVHVYLVGTALLLCILLKPRAHYNKLPLQQAVYATSLHNITLIRQMPHCRVILCSDLQKT